VSAPDLAVFDLDGTLTARDTFLPFLQRVAGRPRLSLALLQASPQVLAAWRDRGRRDALKEVVLRRTLRGRAAADVERAGVSYANLVFETQLRPDMVARLRRHLSEGHECVIASASLRIYVSPLATRLGVEHVLATELEVDGDGRLTGGLVGTNCRAAEKLRRLQELYPSRPITWAYGDSVDDQAMLDRATHATLVGKSPLSAIGAP
jgi:phosphatidylglycerophosphatase C